MRSSRHGIEAVSAFESTPIRLKLWRWLRNFRRLPLDSRSLQHLCSFNSHHIFLTSFTHPIFISLTIHYLNFRSSSCSHSVKSVNLVLSLSTPVVILFPLPLFGLTPIITGFLTLILIPHTDTSGVVLPILITLMVVMARSYTNGISQRSLLRHSMLSNEVHVAMTNSNLEPFRGNVHCLDLRCRFSVYVFVILKRRSSSPFARKAQKPRSIGM